MSNPIRPCANQQGGSPGEMSRDNEENRGGYEQSEEFSHDSKQDIAIKALLERVGRLELETNKRNQGLEEARLRNIPPPPTWPGAVQSSGLPSQQFMLQQQQHNRQDRNSSNQTPIEASGNSQPHQATLNFGPEDFTAEDTVYDCEIQEKFNSVRSSVEKVVLPPFLKLHDSRSGVKRDDQQTLNVISKCGRYVETAIQLLSQSKEEEPFDVKPVITTLTANIQYLQEEYAALLVKGRFDDSTAQLFKSLQKGNSGFDSRAINNVRIAAELSSIQQRGARFQHRPPARGYPPDTTIPIPTRDLILTETYMAICKGPDTGTQAQVAVTQTSGITRVTIKL